MILAPKMFSRLPLYVIDCCLAGVLVVAAFAQTPVPASPLGEAENLVASGHLDQALARLDTLAADQPKNPRIEYLRGMVFYQQEKMKLAASAFAKAEGEDPANLEAVQMHGVSLFRAGNARAAIPLLERANRSVANANIDPNYVLGLCYMDMERYDDARKAFAGQYGFEPDSAPAYLLAARMLLRHNFLPIAEQYVNKALALSPNLPGVRLLMGSIALSKGEVSKAIANFQQESKLDPLNGGPYERLGDAYIQAGDFERAQLNLNRAVLLEPTVSAPFILLGKALLKQENPLMARMYLERALGMDPNNSIAHYLLGQTYRRLGRLEDAQREFHATEQIQAANMPKLESVQ